MNKVYIHIVHREDMDPYYPMYWTEYRISNNKNEVPEFLDAIHVEEKDYLAILYCEKNNLEYEFVGKH